MRSANSRVYMCMLEVDGRCSPARWSVFNYDLVRIIDDVEMANCVIEIRCISWKILGILWR